MSTVLERAKARLAGYQKDKARADAESKRLAGLIASVRKVIARNTPKPLRVRALAEARKALALHIMETGGNNHGPMVEKIILYAGGVVGEPWCVDFVIWCYGHAGSQVVRPGWVRAVRMMHRTGTQRVANPKPGQIVRYSFDHTGVFVSWCDAAGKRVPKARASHIKAIEGNTGPVGAVSDGNGADGVYEKVRERGLVADFLWVKS